MGNFDMPWEKEEQQEQAEVTPIICGEATREEAEEAFEDLFKDSMTAFNNMTIWRKNT